MNRRSNLIGQKFGRLTVKEFSHKSERNLNIWNCECDCGNSNILVSTADLRRKHVVSCGCYKLDKIRETKKHNRYIFFKTIAIGFMKKGHFIIDIEDYEKIKDYCWSNSNGYAKTKRRKKWISQHRLILNSPKDKIIDHINHNKLDNRKINIRLCTQSENRRNMKLKRNEVTGVYKQWNKYAAGIGINGKWLYLGSFNTHDEAVLARKQAEEKYFGEFALKE
jgi:hypothetical protein